MPPAAIRPVISPATAPRLGSSATSSAVRAARKLARIRPTGPWTGSSASPGEHRRPRSDVASVRADRRVEAGHVEALPPVAGDVVSASSSAIWLTDHGLSDAGSRSSAGTQRRPRDPPRVADLVGVEHRFAVDVSDGHRAHLVLDDAVGHRRAVGEVGEGQADPSGRHPELVAEPALDRRAERLAGRRMPTAGVRPHVRPCQLGRRPAGQQHPPGAVRDVTREAEVERRVAAVHRLLRCRPRRPAIAIEEDDQLFGHRALRDPAAAARGRCRGRSRSPLPRRPPVDHPRVAGIGVLVDEAHHLPPAPAHVDLDGSALQRREHRTVGLLGRLEGDRRTGDDVRAEHGADGVDAEAGDGVEHGPFAQRPGSGEVGDEPAERPVVGQEHGQLGVGIGCRRDQVGEQQHRLGHDVVVEGVEVELVAVGEEHFGEGRWWAITSAVGDGRAGPGEDRDGRGGGEQCLDHTVLAPRGRVRMHPGRATGRAGPAGRSHRSASDRRRPVRRRRRRPGTRPDRPQPAPRTPRRRAAARATRAGSPSDRAATTPGTRRRDRARPSAGGPGTSRRRRRARPAPTRWRRALELDRRHHPRLVVAVDGDQHDDEHDRRRGRGTEADPPGPAGPRPAGGSSMALGDPVPQLVGRRSQTTSSGRVRSKMARSSATSATSASWDCSSDIGVTSLQDASQPQQRAAHVALHRAERHVEALGDLALAQAAVEGELEDLARARRERVEGVGDEQSFDQRCRSVSTTGSFSSPAVRREAGACGRASDRRRGRGDGRYRGASPEGCRAPGRSGHGSATRSTNVSWTQSAARSRSPRRADAVRVNERAVAIPQARVTPSLPSTHARASSASPRHPRRRVQAPAHGIHPLGVRGQCCSSWLRSRFEAEDGRGCNQDPTTPGRPGGRRRWAGVRISVVRTAAPTSSPTWHR